MAGHLPVVLLVQVTQRDCVGKQLVRLKQPIFSMRAIGGSHFCFCSSDPVSAIEPIARWLWTPKKVAMETSTRAISIPRRPTKLALFWAPSRRPRKSRLARDTTLK